MRLLTLASILLLTGCGIDSASSADYAAQGRAALSQATTAAENASLAKTREAPTPTPTATSTPIPTLTYTPSPAPTITPLPTDTPTPQPVQTIPPQPTTVVIVITVIAPVAGVGPLMGARMVITDEPDAKPVEPARQDQAQQQPPYSILVASLILAIVAVILLRSRIVEWWNRTKT